MNWLVTKGEDLATGESKHASLEFYQNFWPRQNRKMKLRLLASDAAMRPGRSKDKVCTHSSRKMDNLTNQRQRVYNVAELTIDLNSVPESEFAAMRSPSGTTFYRLNFQVEFAVQSALEFWLSVKGVKYGSVTATYN